MRPYYVLSVLVGALSAWRCHGYYTIDASDGLASCPSTITSYSECSAGAAAVGYTFVGYQYTGSLPYGTHSHRRLASWLESLRTNLNRTGQRFKWVPVQAKRGDPSPLAWCL